jgi:hypothetical protein
LKTPQGITKDDFDAELRIWRLYAECPTCGGKLSFALAHLSIHSTEFGDTCAGGGQVRVESIPFCQKCEEKPVEYGCVHEPMVAPFLQRRTQKAR